MKLDDLGCNSDIQEGYASSYDSATLTHLKLGAINKNSTIGGHSYVFSDGEYLAWYGGETYKDLDEYLVAIMTKAAEKNENVDLDSNLKVLVKSDNIPIAWIDSKELNLGSNQKATQDNTNNSGKQTTDIPTPELKVPSNSGNQETERTASNDNIDGADTNNETKAPSTQTDVSFVPLNSGNETRDEVYEYLKTKTDYNDAAIDAIMGNLEVETHYDTSTVGDGGTSFGLAQWHLERADKFHDYCDKEGSYSVETQLDYMLQELQND